MTTYEQTLQTAMDETGPAETADLSARLTMANHRFFAQSRAAFCRPDTSEANRVFGVETQNERLCQRAIHRAEGMPPRAKARALSMLRAAGDLLDTHGPTIARPLIEAVEARYDSLCPLGPVTADPATDWLIRRPAFSDGARQP